jgi:hypothetical protein
LSVIFRQPGSGLTDPIESGSGPDPKVETVTKQSFMIRNSTMVKRDSASPGSLKPDPDIYNLVPGYDKCAGIFKQSMGARNRVGIELSYRSARLYRLA